MLASIPNTLQLCYCSVNIGIKTSLFGSYHGDYWAFSIGIAISLTFKTILFHFDLTLAHFINELSILSWWDESILNSFHWTPQFLQCLAGKSCIRKIQTYNLWYQLLTFIYNCCLIQKEELGILVMFPWGEKIMEHCHFDKWSLESADPNHHSKSLLRFQQKNEH